MKEEPPSLTVIDLLPLWGPSGLFRVLFGNAKYPTHNIKGLMIWFPSKSDLTVRGDVMAAYSCAIFPPIFILLLWSLSHLGFQKCCLWRLRCGWQICVKQLPADEKYLWSCSLTPGRTSVLFTRTCPADLGSLFLTGCSYNRQTGAGMCFWPT